MTEEERRVSFEKIDIWVEEIPRKLSEVKFPISPEIKSMFKSLGNQIKKTKDSNEDWDEGVVRLSILLQQIQKKLEVKSNLPINVKSQFKSLDAQLKKLEKRR